MSDEGDAQVTWEVRSYDGVGPLQLGVDASAVAGAIGPATRHIDGDEADEGSTDLYAALGVLVRYDADGRVEAIELAGPVVPVVAGRLLLGSSFRDLADWFAERDPDLIVLGDGLTSLTLGVGLYAPSAREDPDLAPEGVIVFPRGYYDTP
jgi:hypothetical protein